MDPCLPLVVDRFPPSLPADNRLMAKSPLSWAMLPFQRDFLELSIARDALRLGEFTLKSGRVSPYFFDAGRLNGGRDLALLGRCYAAALEHAGLGFDMLFGPAYKGIPLATALAIAWSDRCDQNLPVAYNRKEAKAHGEGGTLVGAPLAGRVLIVDDVITAGTAIRETLALIEAGGARAAGVVVALDREERGQGRLSAVQELTRECGVPIVAIARFRDLIDLVGTNHALVQHEPLLRAYLERFGAPPAGDP